MLLNIPILTDIVVILALSIPVILLLHRLKLPSIVGFLITGILAGSRIFNLIPQEEVDILAEIGVILLLFTIGLEFSIPNLIRIRKAAFVAGSLQLILTTLAFGAITYFGTYDFLPIAIFYGFLCTLSSTAIVLKILQIRGEMGSPHGQIILAVLIFQDIAVVPMMLMMPVLAGQSDDIFMAILMMIGKTALVLVVLVLISKFVIRQFLFLVAATKSKELFISAIIVICFSIAYLTSLAGLSLALGAFLAGLVISESEYAHEATSYILPFKEVFTSIFFISIGMLMDVSFLIENWKDILIMTLESLLIQSFMAFWAAKALNVPFKTALLVALALCQIGEFAFVLARSGTEIGLMPIELYQYFLAMSVLTMAIAPILIMNGNRIAYFFAYQIPKPKIVQRWFTKKIEIPNFLQQSDRTNLSKHLIIIGYGLNGQILAKGAFKANIPLLIIEADPRRIKKNEDLQKYILFGDASHDEVLHHAHIEEARLVVITITDVEVTKMLIHKLKSIHSDITIMVRNRKAVDLQAIEQAGADMIITDELETNMTIFTKTFAFYDLPYSESQSLIEEIMMEMRGN